MDDDKCNCVNMNGNMCYPCLVKDYYAISADNFRLIHENERLRKEVARLGSFIHPIGTVTYGIEDMYER